MSDFESLVKYVEILTNRVATLEKILDETFKCMSLSIKVNPSEMKNKCKKFEVVYADNES